MIIKINKPFKYNGKSLTINQKITIPVDNHNNPLALFWRNRIKDAKIDNCISIVTSTGIEKKKEKVNT